MKNNKLINFKKLLKNNKNCIKITKFVEYGTEHYEIDAIRKVEKLRKKVWKYEFLLSFNEIERIFKSKVMSKYLVKNIYRYD